MGAMTTSDASSSDNGQDQSAAILNQEVLDRWYNLSLWVGGRLHQNEDPPDNATFATFAAWATETLRAEIASKDNDGSALGGTRPFRRFYRRTAESLLGNPSIISDNFAAGEKMVYDEIGETLEVFLKEFALDAVPRLAIDPDDDQSAQPWEAKWNDFTEALKKIEVQNRQDSGVDRADLAVLHTAVRPYFDVLANGLSDLSENGPHGHPPGDIELAKKRKRRAEFVLLGNMRLVEYEQHRLQPVVERNLTYLPDAVRARLGTRIMGHNTPTTELLVRAYKASNNAKTLIEIFDEIVEIATSRRLYTLVIGREKFMFGRDLPLPPAANVLQRDDLPDRDRARYGEREFFPYDLQQLKEDRVWRMWQRYDRSNGEGVRTGVDNWRRLYERMNFIVNLFRSRQQLSALYDKPTSARLRPPPGEAELGRVSFASDVTDQRLSKEA
jgi:hypothetical protein